jgi:NAD dependent epimerase/dehydratase family enzyme
MANLVLKGNKVSAKKILSIGFGFRFSLVGDALRDIFDHK